MLCNQGTHFVLQNLIPDREVRGHDILGVGVLPKLLEHLSGRVELRLRLGWTHRVLLLTQAGCAFSSCGSPTGLASKFPWDATMRAAGFTHEEASEVPTGPTHGP